MATKAMSQAPDLSASTDLAAVGTTTSESGTPSRWASSRDRSTDTPRASPVVASWRASTGLPTLIAARSVPVGAIAATTAGDGFTGGVEQAARVATRLMTIA